MTTASEWERAAEKINGMFVCIVYIDDGKVRRYPCATLATARRRADRARERGHEASVILAELRPCTAIPAVKEETPTT